MSNHLKIDEVGEWSEFKLDVIKEYAGLYSKILSSPKNPYFTHIYIDAFAGAGIHKSKRTGQLIKGSPANALSIEPKFKEYHFIDTDKAKIENLAKIAGKRSDVFLYEDDCNVVLPQKVLPRARYEDFRRALCVLDPYGIHLDWEVVKKAGEMGTVDVFINFAIYDININVIRKDKSTVDPKQKHRFTRLWGDSSWEEIAYQPRQSLFGKEDEKISNAELAKAFQNRLKEVAGFEFVPDPLDMRNSSNSTVYYLFFASCNKKANKVFNDVVRLIQKRF